MRLFELCIDLSDEQLDTKMVGAFGSIRETLHHIASSEKSYLHRIITRQPYRRPEGAPAPTLADALQSIRATGPGFVSAAPGITAQDTVVVDWQGTPRAVPCAIILTQAINHATEHRAQIMATLTQLGIQPPDLAGWDYLDATREPG